MNTVMVVERDCLKLKDEGGLLGETGLSFPQTDFAVQVDDDVTLDSFLRLLAPYFMREDQWLPYMISCGIQELLDDMFKDGPLDDKETKIEKLVLTKIIESDGDSMVSRLGLDGQDINGDSWAIDMTPLWKIRHAKVVVNPKGSYYRCNADGFAEAIDDANYTMTFGELLTGVLGAYRFGVRPRSAMILVWL